MSDFIFTCVGTPMLIELVVVGRDERGLLEVILEEYRCPRSRGPQDGSGSTIGDNPVPKGGGEQARL